MSTLAEIGAFLEGLGIGLEGTDMFLGKRPDMPDTALILYEYPGLGPEYIQSSFNPISEVVQLQVVSRAKKYQDAHSRAAAAWTALAPVTNATLSGTYYRSIRPNASPGNMGTDSHDRVLVFFNATIEKEVSLASTS